MKRILLGVLLLTATSAWAEWVRVGGSADHYVYVDLDTIVRSGDKAKLVYLNEHLTVQVDARGRFLSSTVQSEYDCSEKRRRLLFYTWHSGRMGSGDVIFTDNDLGKWRPVVPDSVGEILWKIACGKK